MELDRFKHKIIIQGPKDLKVSKIKMTDCINTTKTLKSIDLSTSELKIELETSLEEKTKIDELLTNGQANYTKLSGEGKPGKKVQIFHKNEKILEEKINSKGKWELELSKNNISSIEELIINMDYHVLYIIGNGFDIAQGLKTQYEDFIKWIKNKNDQEKIDIIINRMPTENELGFFEAFRWEDFETRFAKLVHETIDIKDEKHRYKQIKGLIDAMDNLERLFMEYLSLFDEIDNETENRRELEEIFLYKDGKKIISDETTKKVSNLTILNFNYTSIIPRYFLNKKSEIQDKNLKEFIESEKIPFEYKTPHGNLFEKDIIFGCDLKFLNEDQMISGVYKKSKGYYRNNQKNKLKDYCFDEIHILGHSLIGVDYEYLKNIIMESRNQNNSVQIILYDYLDDAIPKYHRLIQDFTDIDIMTMNFPCLSTDQTEKMVKNINLFKIFGIDDAEGKRIKTLSNNLFKKKFKKTINIGKSKDTNKKEIIEPQTFIKMNSANPVTNLIYTINNYYDEKTEIEDVFENLSNSLESLEINILSPENQSIRIETIAEIQKKLKKKQIINLKLNITEIELNSNINNNNLQIFFNAENIEITIDNKIIDNNSRLIPILNFEFMKWYNRIVINDQSSEQSFYEFANDASHVNIKGETKIAKWKDIENLQIHGTFVKEDNKETKELEEKKETLNNYLEEKIGNQAEQLNTDEKVNTEVEQLNTDKKVNTEAEQSSKNADQKKRPLKVSIDTAEKDQEIHKNNQLIQKVIGLKAKKLNIEKAKLNNLYKEYLTVHSFDSEDYFDLEKQILKNMNVKKKDKKNKREELKKLIKGLQSELFYKKHNIDIIKNQKNYNIKIKKLAKEKDINNILMGLLYINNSNFYEISLSLEYIDFPSNESEIESLINQKVNENF